MKHFAYSCLLALSLALTAGCSVTMPTVSSADGFNSCEGASCCEEAAKQCKSECAANPGVLSQRDCFEDCELAGTSCMASETTAEARTRLVSDVASLAVTTCACTSEPCVERSMDQLLEWGMRTKAVARTAEDEMAIQFQVERALECARSVGASSAQR